MTRIQPILNKVNEADLLQGVSWYVNAHDHAARIANDHGVDFLKVCGIISALSPSVAWEINLRDAESLICQLAYLGSRDVTVSTYGNNKSKAIDIYYSDGARETIERILLGSAGYKTLAFFRNIAHISLDDVTIDRHILSAIGFKEKSLTAKRYRKIQESFVRKAKSINLHPADLQAVVWVAYKRLNNI